MKLDPQSLHRRLEPYFFNSRTVEEVAGYILALEPRWQEFVVNWVLSVAKTKPELGYLFANKAGLALQTIGRDGCENWLQSALDVYFDQGLVPAVESLKNLDHFIAAQRKRSRGLEFSKTRGVLQHFLHGLDGRRLRLESGDEVLTDSEILHLPGVIDHFPLEADNFICFKAIAVHQWAQCWYGTWRADTIAQIPREEPMLRTFHYLETLRLNACIERDYPGTGAPDEAPAGGYTATLASVGGGVARPGQQRARFDPAQRPALGPAAAGFLFLPGQARS